jgi:isoamylase
VPMIPHGDELGRTQQGNNNGYCQDNELTWVDWDLDGDAQGLLGFTRRLVELRRDHPVFRRRRFFAGSADHGGESEIGDIAWFQPDGQHMADDSWHNGFARSMMVFLNGQAIPEPDVRGLPIVDDHFLVLFNASDDDIDFTLPSADYGDRWQVDVDTAADEVDDEFHKPLGTVTAQARSTVVLRCARTPVVAAPAGAGIARR